MAKANPRVAIARRDIEFARARVREVQANWFPRAQAQSFVAPSPDIECLNIECTITRPDQATLALAGVYTGVSLRVVQPLYTSGKLRSAKRAAEHSVSLARFKKATVIDQQATPIARAFYGAKLSRELIHMLEEGRRDIVDADAMVESKLEEGSPDVDLQDQFRIRTLLAEVDARLAEANQAYSTALAGLRALVGDQSIEIEAAPLQRIYEQLIADTSHYAAMAAQKRPEIQVAHYTSLAAASLVALEESKYLPNLALVGELKMARAQGVENPPSAFANDPYNRTTGGIALVLQWEVDPAVQREKANQARIRVSQAKNFGQAVSLGVRFEVEQAFARAKQAEQRWKASRAGARSSRAWVVSIVQAQSLGLAQTKDLADSLLAYFTMRGRVLEATHDWNVAVIELRRAAGRLQETTSSKRQVAK